MAISEERVCVQLYGDDPNTRLMDYLRSRLATVDPVAPYVYADDAEEERVVALIRDMAAGGVDAIAFTSQPQVRRLLQVAFGHGLQALLQEGLARCRVAAVGPVVRGVLEEAGIRVDIMPAQAFFMKPLVTEIMRHFDGGAGA